MKLSLTGFYSCVLLLLASSANGQIIPDGSLSTTVEKAENVTEITGGRQAGSNLFHSFQNFSIPTDHTAFFDNSVDIDNILSRVTGGNISNINGLIRANGNANLFLINPAGIVFGENARLDIGGSFLGSTATGLLFDDGTEFSAVSSQPILTIDAPIGLDLRNTTGNLVNRGNLNSDRNLTLAADNLDLQGKLTAGDNLTFEALNNITIRDSVNNAFVATAGNELSLQGNNIDIFVLSSSNSGLFSGRDLILRSNNPVNGDAHYYSGSNFKVERLDGSLGSLVSYNDPVVRSQDNVSFADYTGASLHILAGGNVIVAGDINITGVDNTANSLQETITLSDGSQIFINGNIEPTLDIRAGTNNINPEGVIGDGITLDIQTATGSNINIAGTVNNPGGVVFLTNQYEPNNQLTQGNITVTAIDTSNMGNGGDVTIDSANNITIAGGINTSSIVDSQLTTIATDSIIDRNIVSGNGGAISLFAVENITVGDLNTASGINLNLITEVDTIEEANLGFPSPFANLQVGKGGRINLNSGNNIVVGNINSGSSLEINSNSTALDNFSIISAFLEFDLADGGNVDLNADRDLNAQNINSSVLVSGRFVSNVETTPDVTLSVSELTLTIPQGNIGSGGNIFLQAQNQINTGSLNSSVAVISEVDNTANILADDPNTATAEQPSRAFSTVDILAENINLGRGGTIRIESDRANLGDLNSSIGVTSQSMAFAQARAENSAGANSFANNKINFNVAGDRPGGIILNVDRALNFSNLNSSATVDAVNNLDSQATSQGDDAVALASTSDRFGNDSLNQIAFDSEVNLASIEFSFNPPDVDYVLGRILEIPSNNIQAIDFDTCPINAQIKRQPEAIETAKGKIYPARGIVIKNGQVILTAKPTNSNAPRPSTQTESCL